MVGSSSYPPARPARGRLIRAFLARWMVVLAALILWMATPALAGQAASGELFFYPCTSCHPLTATPDGEQPAKALPNDFEGHEIALVGHDELGQGDAACLVCHDDPSKDPGMLKLADGSLIDIKGDIAQVCYRCHSEKYKEWEAGIHGRGQPKCSASGCHDPHTPGWIYVESLFPFIGTGFQFKALSGREAFSPLAPPAPVPAVETPSWFLVLATLGLVAAVGQIVRLVRGRQKR